MEVHDPLLVTVFDLHLLRVLPIALGVGFVEGLAGFVVFVPKLFVHVARLHDQRLRSSLGVEESNFLVEFRPFESKLFGGHAVLDNALAVGVGAVVLERQVGQRPVLDKPADHDHGKGHEPFFLRMVAATLHGLSGNQVQREVQHWESPMQHAFRKDVGHCERSGVQKDRLTRGVQLDASEESTQQDGRHEDQQHDVLQETLVGRQRNRVPKTPALEHALVRNLHDRPRGIHNFLGAVRVAGCRVPSEPREEHHHHGCQHSGELGQGPHKNRDAQQDLGNADKYGQFQSPWREELQVHGTGLEVLLELVHEAQCVVRFDQS